MINRVVTISPSAKETQVFLGLVGFWRLHIPGYSQFLTQKKRYFEWGLEQQEAFGHLKEETARMVALEPVLTGKSVQNVLCTVAREHILTRSLWQKKKTSGESPGQPLGFWGWENWGSEAHCTPENCKRNCPSFFKCNKKHRKMETMAPLTGLAQSRGC